MPRGATVRAGLACTAAAAAVAFTGSAGAASTPYTVVPSPNAFTGYNELHGVSASSPADAWAVGSLCCRPGRFGDGTLTEHWAGTGWSIVSSPDFYRIDDVLNGVADLSPANAWAVGYLRPFASASHSPLIIHWNGSSWGVATPPGLSGTLNAVSADSPTNIWAVGDDGHGHAVALKYDGTAWTSVPLPAAGAVNTLQGVKAFSPSDAWAVGYQLPSATSTVAHTLIMHWDGSRWSVVTSPSPDPNSNSLHAVTGVTSKDLWAVGQQGADETVTGAPPGTRTLIEHWDGTRWSVVASPNVGDQDTLNAVAAATSTSVAAVGSYQNTSGTVPVHQTLALQWNGTSWAAQQTPNVGPSDNQLRGAATVPGAGKVWAVGFFWFVPPSGFYGANQTLILRNG